MKKVVFIVLIVAVILGGAGFWYWQAQADARTTFHMEKVTRGRLVATIGSTGTLQAQEVVDVGAQVLGRIIFIGKDKNTRSGIIDWGSEVQGPVLDKDGNIIKLGTLLAQIDPALYDAAVKAAKASVDSAKASVMSSQATVLSAAADVEVKKATLFQATRDWGRAETLITTKGIQQAEHDQLRAAWMAATANLKVSEANYEVSKVQVDVAKAQVGVAEANLKTAQTNLDYATISAPVTGKVVDRRVNMGQTVVASLSAPSLFLIAKDLKKMEVWATVNEVDVGKIHAGQDVDYTVDALPGKVRRGKVVPQGKLDFRLNATMNSNVVTYTVVVSVENEDELLKPYMTTNLSFIVEDKANALLVPNAALRWLPAKQQVAPDQRDSYGQLKNKKRSATDTDAMDQGFVWVAGDDGFVRYIQVRTGMSDGSRTEILKVIDGDLPENTRLIVGEGRAGARNDAANPFSSPMFQSKKKE